MENDETLISTRKKVCEHVPSSEIEEVEDSDKEECTLTPKELQVNELTYFSYDCATFISIFSLFQQPSSERSTPEILFKPNI